MKQLRDQLDAARAEYGAIRYPGSLAGDVLPSRRTDWRRWALLTGGFSAGSLAAAAAIVLSLINFLPLTTRATPSSDVLAQVTGTGGGLSSFARLPEQISHLSTVIPYQKVRSTLHMLGLPIDEDAPETAPASQDSDRAAAA